MGALVIASVILELERVRQGNKSIIADIRRITKPWPRWGPLVDDMKVEEDGARDAERMVSRFASVSSVW